MVNYYQQQPQTNPIWAGGQGMGAGIGGMMRGLNTQPIPQKFQQELPLMQQQPQETNGESRLDTSGLAPASQRTAAEEYAGLNPLAGSIAKDSLLSSAGKAAAKNALKTGIGYGMTGNLDIGGLMNPKSLISAIPKAMVSSLGFERPEGFLGWAASQIPNVASFALGGGVPGLALGMMGTPLSDALGDFLGFRSGDEARDELEDASGELRGRRQFRDSRKQFDVDDLRKLDQAKTMKEARDLAREVEQLEAGRQIPNVDRIASELSQKNMYNQLNKIIEFNKMKEAQQSEALQAERIKQAELARAKGLERRALNYRTGGGRDGGSGFGGGTVNENSGNVGSWGGGVTL